MITMSIGVLQNYIIELKKDITLTQNDKQQWTGRAKLLIGFGHGMWWYNTC